jgi:ferredoxin-NADP reductase
MTRTVRVVARQTVAVDVVALSLADLAGAELPEWTPGAHIDLLLPNGLQRQYSLCGDPADRRCWRVAVLREKAGRGGSAYVHDHLDVGAVVGVRGPRNHFPFAAGPRHLFIAGGIGITPILPMLAAADACGSDWRLAYGGRSRSSMAFLDELAWYGPRVAVYPQDEVGLLDLDRLLATADPATPIYCCGPEPLIAAVEARTAGRDLHVERFRPTAVESEAGDQPFDVVLQRTGRTVRVPAGVSILAALEAAGIDVLHSCREGTCGTCETGVVAGEPDHRDSVLTDADRAANDCMMICVSRAKTPQLVLDL